MALYVLSAAWISEAGPHRSRKHSKHLQLLCSAGCNKAVDALQGFGNRSHVVLNLESEPARGGKSSAMVFLPPRSDVLSWGRFFFREGVPSGLLPDWFHHFRILNSKGVKVQPQRSAGVTSSRMQRCSTRRCAEERKLLPSAHFAELEGEEKETEGARR